MLEKWLLKHRNFCVNFSERMLAEYAAIQQAGNPGDIFAPAPTTTAASTTAASTTAASTTAASTTAANHRDTFAPTPTRPPLPASVESFIQSLPTGNSVKDFSTTEHYFGKVHFVDCGYVVIKFSRNDYTILSPGDLSRAGFSTLPAKEEKLEIVRGKKREIQFEKVRGGR